MPIPKPNSSEKKDKEKGKQKFISRCMGDTTMNNDYKDQKQRAAVCYAQWEKVKKQKKAKGSDEDPDWDVDCDKGPCIIL